MRNDSSLTAKCKFGEMTASERGRRKMAHPQNPGVCVPLNAAGPKEANAASRACLQHTPNKSSYTTKFTPSLRRVGGQ